jgi:hypothetical protein
MGVGITDIYVDPANPNSIAVNENATRLNRLNEMAMQRGAVGNVAKAEQKKKQEQKTQTAQGVKTLLADLTTLEKGTKTLLGM